MRVVLQRTKQSAVSIEGEIVGSISHGFVLLVGITHEDTEEDVHVLVKKITNLRVFEDEEGKMNHSLLDVNGSILSVSQFTLYGNVKKGNRPSFTNAAHPEVAERLYDYFNEQLREQGIHVETGRFGAMMDVRIQNDGPVTILMETEVGKLVS